MRARDPEHPDHDEWLAKNREWRRAQYDRLNPGAAARRVERAARAAEQAERRARWEAGREERAAQR